MKNSTQKSGEKKIIINKINESTRHSKMKNIDTESWLSLLKTGTGITMVSK